ncbi:ABC transporter substrate-binding protein [Nonomuraea sp. NPDC046802]|uniref:ABC transporter substrate-binding protein n=1 Tax=Nonomuraea sp. NPDC046802 TaxID=3154919 RepID=UPI0033E80ED5
MTHHLSRRTFLAGSAVTAAGLAGVLSACSTSKSGGSNPQLRYQFFTTQALPDATVVQEALNAHLKKAGADFTIKLEPMDMDAFTKRMPLDFASGSAGDIFFTASWLNNYYTNASTGNFLALDDLLPKHAPKLWASFPKNVWDAARVGGRIYGVPNAQLWPYRYGFLARQDIAEKYKLDLQTLNTYEDLEPFLAAVKAGERGKTALYTDNTGAGLPWAAGVMDFDLIGATFGVAVRPDDANLTVLNMYDTDEFRAACQLARKWYKAGYMATNAPSPADAGAAWANGQIMVQLMQVRGTGLPAFPTVGKSLMDPWLTTSGVLGSITAVNRDTQSPERAVALLERLNTDQDFYNLICFGVEGKHYAVTDKSLRRVGFPSGVTAESDRYNPNTDWQFGNQFNAYYRDEAAAKAKLWDEQKKLNESAKPSAALGFTADTDPVKTEVANVSAVVTEYQLRNFSGLVDPSTGVPEFVDRLKKAGIDKIIAEFQKQIGTWRESH